MDTTKTKQPISPSRQRAMHFLHSLGKKLGRRLQNDLIYSSEEDLNISSRCTSTDSMSFSNDTKSSRSIHSSSIDLSCEASNESLSSRYDEEENSHHVSRKRSPIASMGKVFQHFATPSSRSHSCTSMPLKESNQSAKQKQKSKQQPQRILRQPVNYVYLKGMSGLPTRRVPRSSLCCNYAYQ